MELQKDTAREQQNSTAPKVQQEPSTGGTATIVDDRPSTVYQRKLRETMNASAAAKAMPLQRKTPKGATRFQQIATAMGEQHGVDTSGLVATHNSSFPGKLNAEATIQGHNIHFAPGKDTDYNIRHEVAHAIDNTLNGTPKGNKVINGQNIDTTRENAADRMAKAPLTQRKGKVNSNNGNGLEKEDTMSMQRVGVGNMASVAMPTTQKRGTSQTIVQRVQTMQEAELAAADRERDIQKLTAVYEYMNTHEHQLEQLKEAIYDIFGTDTNVDNDYTRVSVSQDMWDHTHEMGLFGQSTDAFRKVGPISRTDNDNAYGEEGDYFHARNPNPLKGSKMDARIILNIKSQADAFKIAKEITDHWNDKGTGKNVPADWQKRIISLKFWAASPSLPNERQKYDKMVIYFDRPDRQIITHGVRSFIKSEAIVMNDDLSAFYKTLAPGIGYARQYGGASYTTIISEIVAKAAVDIYDREAQPPPLNKFHHHIYYALHKERGDRTAF